MCSAKDLCANSLSLESVYRAWRQCSNPCTVLCDGVHLPSLALSTLTKTAFGANSFCTKEPLCSSLSNKITFAPLWTNKRAVASPRPLAAPVIKNVLPSIRIGLKKIFPTPILAGWILKRALCQDLNTMRLVATRWNEGYLRKLGAHQNKRNRKQHSTIGRSIGRVAWVLFLLLVLYSTEENAASLGFLRMTRLTFSKGGFAHKRLKRAKNCC